MGGLGSRDQEATAPSRATDPHRQQGRSFPPKPDRQALIGQRPLRPEQTRHPDAGEDVPRRRLCPADAVDRLLGERVRRSRFRAAGDGQRSRRDRGSTDRGRETEEDQAMTIVHTDTKPKRPSTWARYEVFYSMSGTRTVEASSPEDAMAKFMAFSTAELAEDAELESLDPVLVNEENAT